MQHTCVPGPGNFSRKKTERENDSRLRVSAPHSHCTRRRWRFHRVSLVLASDALLGTFGRVIQQVPAGHRRFRRDTDTLNATPKDLRVRSESSQISSLLSVRERHCDWRTTSSPDKGQRSAGHKCERASDSAYFGTSLARTHGGGSARDFARREFFDTHLASPPLCRFGVA